MKTVIKTSIGRPFFRPYCILTAIALGLLALSPGMQAVSPAPDGGYPGRNTAEGQRALLQLATGTYNTALGWASLGFNVNGNYNAVAADSLLNNTADPKHGHWHRGAFKQHHRRRQHGHWCLRAP